MKVVIYARAGVSEEQMVEDAQARFNIKLDPKSTIHVRRGGVGGAGRRTYGDA